MQDGVSEDSRTRDRPAAGGMGFTLRAALIALVLTGPVTWWVVQVEYVRCTLHPTLISLFATSVFVLALLVAANAGVRRWLPGRELRPAELLTVYVMLNISTCMVSHHFLQVLVSSIPYAARFSTPYNDWGALFADRLPRWLTVRDPVSLKGFYEGGDLYAPENYGPWLVPIACWSVFIMVLFGMFLCLNVLLRRQWTEREKLSYPLVQLPVALVAENAPLLRNRLFWIGFAIAGGIDLVNGLHQFYPSIPQIPIKTYNPAMFSSLPRPWDALGWVPVTLYPMGIGLGMLLPLDMLFSCWFFFWVWKAEFVITRALGWDAAPQMPYVPQQSVGAYLGIAIFALVMARHHLAGLLWHFLGRPSDVDDSEEAISYRTAMWLLAGGTVFLLWFAWKAGMSLWLTGAFLLVFFAISLAITRMRAEMGLPAHDLQASGPDALLPGILGTRTLGTENAAALSLFQWFNRGYQSHVMPFQLESMRMAHGTRREGRGTLAAMWIAAVVGTVLGFWVLLHTIYSLGGATSHFAPPICPLHLGGEPWNRMGAWAAYPTQGSPAQGLAVLAGLAVTLFLNAVRVQVAGFPLHPVGYAVSSSWSMHVLWMPMFVAWLMKLPLIRYGGLPMYRRLLPLFFGLIVGDCVVGCAWTIIGLAGDLPSYRFFP